MAVLAPMSMLASGQSWRGIVPLKSTRADIEKLLGTPQPPPADGRRFYTLNENRSIYVTDDGEVYVLYARFTECQPEVGPDTVLWVSVKPTTAYPISDLRIDESKFATYDPAEPKGLGYKAYEDSSKGFTILTFKGMVEQVYYQPIEEDRKLCPNYFEDGKVIPFQIHTHVGPYDAHTGSIIN